MLEQLSGFIIDIIESTGYIGIFILMTLESALIPIPSEVTMPFAGYLAQNGSLSFFLVVLIGTLGNLVGSLIAYAVGYYLEETVIVRLIEKYGKFILLSKHEYFRAVGWYKRYGNSITFFSRLLPAVRTFISLPAGLAEMNIWKFSLYTFLGSFIWSAILTYVGYYLGKKWNIIGPVFEQFHVVIIIVFIGGALYYINHKLKIIPLGRKR